MESLSYLKEQLPVLLDLVGRPSTTLRRKICFASLSRVRLIDHHLRANEDWADLWTHCLLGNSSTSQQASGRLVTSEPQVEKVVRASVADLDFGTVTSKLLWQPDDRTICWKQKKREKLNGSEEEIKYELGPGVSKKVTAWRTLPRYLQIIVQNLYSRDELHNILHDGEKGIDNNTTLLWPRSETSTFRCQARDAAVV